MRTELIEIAIETINNRVASDREYNVENFMDGELNFYIWEGIKDLNDLSPYGEIQNVIDQVKIKYTEEQILKALKESSSLESGNIYREENSIASWIYGEAEIQIEELNEAIKELSPDEIQEVVRGIDCYWNPGLGAGCSDCVYDDRNYDVSYLVTDIDSFKEQLKEVN